MNLKLLAKVSATLMLAVGGSAAFAQDKAVQGDDAVHAKMEAQHQSLHKMLDAIGATPAQSNQIADIRQRYEHEKLQLKLAGAPKEEVAARFKALQDEAAKAVANVLSPEQIDKLHSTGGVIGLLEEDQGASPWDFLRQLNLNQDQRIQMKQIVARANAAMDAIKQDGSLSPREAKIKMGELHAKAIAQIHAILTPAQQQHLHQLMEDQSDGRKITP